MFWGVDAAGWAAIGAVATAIITFILVTVGAYQIASIRRQNRRWRTLDACERYYLDAYLGETLRRLRQAHVTNQFAGHEQDFKLDVVRLLNYLDGIAIGIFQGL